MINSLKTFLKALKIIGILEQATKERKAEGQTVDKEIFGKHHKNS